MKLPDQKQFAFSIIDDTDDATLENIKPVYDLLSDRRIFVTKTVWPQDCPEGSQHFFAADTLQRHEYRDYICKLAGLGHEIASHGATMEASKRPRTQAGIEFLKDTFGSSLRMHCNHAQNTENLYWGVDRYQSAIIGPLVRAANLLLRSKRYMGHVPNSPYFWGDICVKEFEYVRNFTFDRLDLSKIRPGRPYRISKTGFVQNWFSTSDAPDVNAFARLVTPDALDKLSDTQGIAIVSTHLGKGFSHDGKVDPRFLRIVDKLTELGGWYVPASNILDRLRAESGHEAIEPFDLFRLELSHIFQRLRIRFTNND